MTQANILKISPGKRNELEDVKLVLDSAVIYIKTDAHGRFTYVNDKFCKVSKFSRQELIGKDYSVVNSRYHPLAFWKDLWDTIRAGDVWRGEIRNKAKDGSYFWVDTTVVPFCDEKGVPYQYVAIHYDVTMRKQMEEAVDLLPQRIIQAQEEEDERISREIHDDLGQSLASLKMMIQTVQTDLEAGKGKGKQGLKKAVHYMDGIIDKARQLSTRLRPSTLDVLGFRSALKTLLDEFQANKAFKIHLSCGKLDDLVFEGDAINLYRIVQEAFVNISRHAGARNVDVVVRKMKGILRVSITDDGKGFPGGDKKNSPQKGLGLLTMEERAKLLGGQLNIRSDAQKGTTVTVTIPVRSKGDKRG